MKSTQGLDMKTSLKLTLAALPAAALALTGI